MMDRMDFVAHDIQDRARRTADTLAQNASIDFDLPERSADLVFEGEDIKALSCLDFDAKDRRAHRLLAKAFGAPWFFGHMYLYLHPDPNQPIHLTTMLHEIMPRLQADPHNFRAILNEYGLVQIQLYVTNLYQTILARLEAIDARAAALSTGEDFDNLWDTLLSPSK